MPQKIAIAISDLHLSLTPPACRADKDWMETQADYLQQVHMLTCDGDLPVLCAGDVFDRWNPTPELIHFALEHLPSQTIAVPGQHDLPNHRMEEMRRSGYGVLEKAGRLRDLSGRSLEFEDFWAHGFAWGHKIVPSNKKSYLQNKLHIVLIHQYVWIEGAEYPGAPREAHADRLAKQLKGYDVAVFGDNHKNFLCKLKTGVTVLNVGGFIRRKSDERSYAPRVGVIYDDGSVVRHRLDTSGDEFHDNPDEQPETVLNMRAFVEDLKSLGEQGLNFQEEVRRFLRKNPLSPEVEQMVLESLKGE